MPLYYQSAPDENNNRSWGTYDPSMGALTTIPEQSYQGEYGLDTRAAQFGYYGPDTSNGEYPAPFNQLQNPTYSTWAEYQADPYGVGANRYNPYGQQNQGYDQTVDFLRQLTSKAQYEGGKSADQMLYERWLEQNGPQALPAGIGGEYKSAFTTPDANQGWGDEYHGVANRARSSQGGTAYDVAKYYLSQPGFVQKYGRAYAPEEIGLNPQVGWDAGQGMWDGYINSQIAANKDSGLGGFLKTFAPFLLPPLLGIAGPALAGSLGGAVTGIDAASAAGAIGGAEVAGLSPLVTSSGGGALSSFLNNQGSPQSGLFRVGSKLANEGLSSVFGGQSLAPSLGQSVSNSPVRTATGTTQPLGSAVTGATSSPEISSLASDVGSQPLSQAVATYSRPKPRIRLSEGFRRGY